MRHPTQTYRVITLRGRRGKGHTDPGAFVYVGNAFAGLDAHPLGNRFLKHADPLGQYEAWLNAMPDAQLFALLAGLRADTECGRLPLACYCCDAFLGEKVVCHAQVLAELMALRYPEDLEEFEW